MIVLFFLGIVILLGSHFFTAILRAPREHIVARVGAGPYKGLFSIIALIGLLLVVLGWGGADRTVIYSPPYWTRQLTYLFMLLALILFAASSLPSGKLAAMVKHPMLTGAKIWAFAHLLVNGDVRSIVLFGGFLAFAVIDRIAVKRRGVATPAPGPVTNDLIAVGVGIVAWVAIYLFLHPYIAGVPIAV